MRDAPRLLDLFCGAGGAAGGYSRAGFEVVGVDINPQPNYPFEFHQAGAEQVLEALVEYGDRASLWGRYDLSDFAVIHASPPCQAYSQAQRLRGRGHPDLVGSTRWLLQALAVPYVIENVPGAPLVDPIELCGLSFPPLRVYRHRLFESSAALVAPPHFTHAYTQTKMGRRAKPGEWLQVVGNFSGADEARAAMGIDWMTRAELAEAIPPAYTEYVGRQLMAALA